MRLKSLNSHWRGREMVRSGEEADGFSFTVRYLEKVTLMLLQQIMKHIFTHTERLQVITSTLVISRQERLNTVGLVESASRSLGNNNKQSFILFVVKQTLVNPSCPLLLCARYLAGLSVLFTVSFIVLESFIIAVPLSRQIKPNLKPQGKYDYSFNPEI